VELTDAELLGMPTILTVSPRSLAAGGVEVTDPNQPTDYRPDHTTNGVFSKLTSLNSAEEVSAGVPLDRGTVWRA
jgi:hypothetical protein